MRKPISCYAFLTSIYRAYLIIYYDLHMVLYASRKALGEMQHFLANLASFWNNYSVKD